MVDSWASFFGNRPVGELGVVPLREGVPLPLRRAPRIVSGLTPGVMFDALSPSCRRFATRVACWMLLEKWEAWVLPQPLGEIAKTLPRDLLNGGYTRRRSMVDPHSAEDVVLAMLEGLVLDALVATGAPDEVVAAFETIWWHAIEEHDVAMEQAETAGLDQLEWQAEVERRLAFVDVTAAEIDCGPLTATVPDQDTN